MNASDLMTRCVISVKPRMSVAEAIATMLDHRVSGVPVLDEGGRLVGMVTEGDFLHRPETGTAVRRRAWLDFLRGPGGAAELYAHEHGRTVADVMTTEVVSVREDTPVSEIVGIMEAHGIKRVPVLDETGRTVGIVSRADLMTALAECLPAAGSQSTDAAVRRALVRAMRTQSWCPLQSVTVGVRDGVVTLHGLIFDDRQRRALHVLASNAQGVKGVVDDLTWVEPMSGTVIEEPAVAPGAV